MAILCQRTFAGTVKTLQPGETYVEQLAGVENSLGRIAKIWGILQVSEKDESLRVKPEFLTVA
jgi:hypothetical protein